MPVFLISIFFLIQLPVNDTITINEFYRVFSFGNPEEIGKIINNIESSGNMPNLNAYLGAMMMKKAFLEKTTGEKLNRFRAGHKLLEAEISKSPQNIEFRFLRLAIQEHAPDFLKYNKNLQEDREIIKGGYRTLDSVIQDYILKYSVKSKVLAENDLH